MSIDKDFTTRLRDYRLSEGFHKKAAFAMCLRVSEQLYYCVESGSKKPSKDFISRLVHYSNKSEIYWLYGIEDNFQNLKSILDTFSKYELSKIANKDCSKEIMDQLDKALYDDILQIALNKK